MNNKYFFGQINKMQKYVEFLFNKFHFATCFIILQSFTIFKIQKIEKMEGRYEKLINDLDARQKHIIQLQSQLLRVDYQYGVIVKDLKKQYSQIAHQHNNNIQYIKQLKRQVKKLNSALSAKERQKEQAMSKVEDQRMRSTFMQQSAKRIKQQNEQLRNEIKYLEGNQNKYHMKVQQANRKKQQMRQQCMRMQQKIEVLEKQIKKSQLKRKQLQQLVQQQVMQTKQRIQNMGVQLFAKTQLEMTQNMRNVNPDQVSRSLRATVRANPEQLVSDWESDMKKLKNCIDYGNSYIVVFDPMNLDRAVSREIFKFLKSCIKEKCDMETKIAEAQVNQQKVVKQQKQILQNFQRELHKIAQEKNKKPTVDTQVQTESMSSQQAQKTIMQLSELNTKLKAKNSSLIECLDYLALRNVVTMRMLKNSHISCQYFKKIVNSSKPLIQSKQNDCQNNPKSAKRRIRKVFNAIHFIIILNSKAKNNKKLSQNQEGMNRLSQQVSKLRKQILCLPGNRMKNLQIQKLKQKILIEEQVIPHSMEEAVSYYQFKLKNILRETVLSKQMFA